MPGALRVSDEKRQLVGVRVGAVEPQSISRVIRTVGRVAVDENRQYRLVAATEGLVKRMSSFSVGSLVRKHELLLVYYARDYLRPQQVYFAALDFLANATQLGSAPERLAQARGQLRLAIDDLLNFGMDETQVAELAKTRKLTPDIEVRSPITGYVMARNVSPEQRFDRGVELYRIADLAKVWILVDVFENESRDLRSGTHVRATPAYPGARPFEARVSDALPQFDPDSRTMKVRLDADNSDFGLRPGMFVDAEVPVSIPSALTVPVGAVVDSGTLKTVFVDRGNGYLEPRHVETGWRFDDRIQITKGLSAGDRIVLSGTFLLDSEARMKAAASGISAPTRDPVCGMEIDQGKARADGKTVAHQGRTFYFCSDQCKKTFEGSPAKYAGEPPRPAEPAAPRSRQPGQLQAARHGRPRERAGARATPAIWARPPLPDMPGTLTAIDAARLTEGQSPTVAIDPSCGVVVVREDAEKAGLTSEHQGRSWFFSSKACKDRFDREPEKFAPKTDRP